MNVPPRRSDEQAEAVLAAELRRLEPRRQALGDAGTFAVAGWTLAHGYEWEAAALAWARAASLDPDDPEAVFQEGAALLELGRWDDAADRFRSAIEVDERLTASGRDGIEWMENDPAYRLGVALHAKGDLRGALEAYERSAERNPSGTEALREAARCRIALAEPDAALEVIDRLERRAVRLTLRAEIMVFRADIRRLRDGRP